MLSRKFVNSYEPKFGYRIQLQRLHGLPASNQQLLHYVVSQYVPPGRLLRTDPKMGPDVHVYKDFDFKSKWNSLQFQEEMNFIGLAPNDKVGVVFEVKGYDPK